MAWALLLLFGTLQRARSQPETACSHPDTSATIASLLAADSALAAEAARRGAAAVLEAFEPDAAMLFSGQPILRADSGRSAFMTRYGAPSTYRWRALHAIASADGRLGCTVGLSSFRNAREPQGAEHIGLYETCWQRDGSGRWWIVAQQRNDSPADPSSDENERRATWPRSATVAQAGDLRAQALDADAEFARLAAEPAGPGPAFVHFAAEDGMMLGLPTFVFGRQQIERRSRDSLPIGTSRGSPTDGSVRGVAGSRSPSATRIMSRAATRPVRDATGSSSRSGASAPTVDWSSCTTWEVRAWRACSQDRERSPTRFRRFAGRRRPARPALRCGSRCRPRCGCSRRPSAGDRASGAAPRGACPACD